MTSTLSSVWTTAEQLRAGTLQPEAVLDDVLRRIAQRNPQLHAYLSVDEIVARERIAALKRQPVRGKLYGVPVLIKDNICVRGQLTTCASKILHDFRPPYNATVIDRLEAEGAVILGRANMDEFAFGSSTESSCYGITKNPWDLGRIPGGSSGGSAAAVAADMALAALGSDTGGSIRQPAAFCGVVGLKPTYGRVSRYGLIAFASSLDQIGPLTRDVRDSALLLEVLAGHDPHDSTSANLPVEPYTQRLQHNVKSVRVGIPKEYFVQDGMDPEVGAAMEQAIAVLTTLGAQCRETSLPHTPYAIATYYVVATAEASSNLARFDGVQYGHRAPGSRLQAPGNSHSLEPTASSLERSSKLFEMYAQTREEGFGAEAKRRIMLGTYALSHGYYDAYYLQGLKARALIKQDFDRAFRDFDCLITPTSPTAAFRIGEKMQDPLTMYLSDIYTISANLAGIPALSLPCGLTKMQLPIGLQLLAAPFREELLFQTAYAYEQATAWHTRRPAL